MARVRPEYDDFVALVNPDNLAIRAALFGHFFPDGVNTRCPVTFEFKVSILSDFTPLLTGCQPRFISYYSRLCPWCWAWFCLFILMLVLLPLMASNISYSGVITS